MFPRLREEAVLALKANEVSPALAFQLSSLL
jgi:ADP-ribosylation factor-binding protein GGA